MGGDPKGSEKCVRARKYLLFVILRIRDALSVDHLFDFPPGTAGGGGPSFIFTVIRNFFWLELIQVCAFAVLGFVAFYFPWGIRALSGSASLSQ